MNILKVENFIERLSLQSEVKSNQVSLLAS